MFRVSFFLCILTLISACNPSGKKIEGNQFSLHKQKISFSGHALGHWPINVIPQCKQCSFNLYTKKMLPGAMLFKEINNARGDLIFLSATNIRHHFALQTGGNSYSIGVKIKGDRLLLASDFQDELAIEVNQVKSLQFGQQHYSVSLQSINADKGSVDLVFWLAKPL